jgi:hypothetical protein
MKPTMMTVVVWRRKTIIVKSYSLWEAREVSSSGLTIVVEKGEKRKLSIGVERATLGHMIP